MLQTIKESVATTGIQTISIPTGKFVAVEGYVQSSGNQQIKITDSTGKVVANISGKSSSGGNYTQIGSQTFVAGGDGTFKVELTNGAGILSKFSEIEFNGKVYLQVYTFITNDGGIPGGDNDVNDLLATITIFRSKG